MIEVKYDDFPPKRAGLFAIKLTPFGLAPYSLDSPQADSPRVALSHTFEMTDTAETGSAASALLVDSRLL
jgi:hypothetical protein